MAKCSRLMAPFLLLLVWSCANGPGGVQITSDPEGFIFFDDEDAALVLGGSSGAINWQIENAWGEAVLRGQTSDRSPTRVAVKSLGPGYYELTGGGAAHPTSFAIVNRPVKSNPANAMFGVQTHFAQGWERDVLEPFDRLGAVLVRDELYWNEVERTKGNYRFNQQYRAYMRDLEQRGIEPLIILSFANDRYDDGQTPHSPEARQAYGRYGAAVLAEFGDQISALEVWNEYNGSFCEGEHCEGDRTESYAALLNDATTQIRAVPNWNGTIVGGAVVRIPVPYLRRLFERGALDDLDAVAVHPYGSTPDSIAQELSQLRAAMSEHGDIKPIWVTEWGLRAPNEDKRLETARFLARTSIIYRSEGVQRAYWYLLRDYFDKFTGFGLLRLADSAYGRYAPTPAFPAYAQVIAKLERARPLCRVELDPRTHAYVFRTSNGETMLAAWSQSGESKLEMRPENPASLEDVAISDIFGAPKTPESKSAGRVSVSLGPDPVYVVGPLAQLTETRTDTLAADNDLQFSIDDRTSNPNDGTGWRHGQGQLTAAGMVLSQLSHDVSDWGESLTSANGGWGSVAGAGFHPDEEDDAPYIVSRWRADRPVSGVAEISVRNSGRGDGVEALVLVNGDVVWRKLVATQGESQDISANISISLAVGDFIDIAIGPGPENNIHFDATSARLRLLANDRSQHHVTLCNSSSP